VIAFQLNDMTCGHCASAIAKAVKAVDQGARIDVHIDEHQVRIEPTWADAPTLSNAIVTAGYSPVQLQVAGSAVAAQGGGSCCRRPTSPASE
jgi:copper chaperone